ncbi:hypothetical protein LOTGIDRAFT_69751, partial [Lottia gigantea]
KMGEFNSSALEFGALADFLIVYIVEAHAADDWALDYNKFKINEHKDLKSRLETAEYVRNHFEIKIPVVADVMGNLTSASYAAFPIKLCLIREGRIQFLSGFDP